MEQILKRFCLILFIIKQIKYICGENSYLQEGSLQIDVMMTGVPVANLYLYCSMTDKSRVESFNNLLMLESICARGIISH